jgi:hypothetical protein
MSKATNASSLDKLPFSVSEALIVVESVSAAQMSLSAMTVHIPKPVQIWSGGQFDVELHSKQLSLS